MPRCLADLRPAKPATESPPTLRSRQPPTEPTPAHQNQTHLHLPNSNSATPLPFTPISHTHRAAMSSDEAVAVRAQGNEQFKAKARQKFAHDLVGWKYWLLIFSILVSAGLAVVQVFLRFLQYHTPDGATAIQGVLEIVAWGVAIWRNLFLISTIRKQHRDVGSGQAFSWPAILYHSTLGRQV